MGQAGSKVCFYEEASTGIRGLLATEVIYFRVIESPTAVVCWANAIHDSTHIASLVAMHVQDPHPYAESVRGVCMRPINLADQAMRLRIPKQNMVCMLSTHDIIMHYSFAASTHAVPLKFHISGCTPFSLALPY